MTACEVWVARDWLARHGYPDDIPACDHDQAECPPLKGNEVTKTDPWAPVAIRWSCPCGRWIPEASLDEQDRIDPGAYFGVTTTITGICSRCGVIDNPRLITLEPSTRTAPTGSQE